MNNQSRNCDERATAIVGNSCRIGYLMLSFGVLIIAFVRTITLHQVCWDLLGLYFVSSLTVLVYQRIKKAQIIPWRWILLMGLAGAAFGTVIAVLRVYF